MKNKTSERSKKEKKILVIIALILGLFFVILRCIIYLTPYEFFSASDTYRDYTSIQTYILQGENLPIDVPYRDRPFFYYFTVNIYLLTGVSLFDLLRIIIPLLFALVTLFFYIFYKAIFQKEFIAIAGAVITVTNNKFFAELVEVRPSTMALVLFPIVGYFFVQWLRNKQNNRWLLPILITGMLALHLSHFFGTLITAFLAIIVFAQYIPKIKKYWLITIPILSIITTACIMFWNYVENLLPVRTLLHASRVFTSKDTSLISVSPLSLSEILVHINMWYALVAVSGLAWLIIDIVKRKKIEINTWVLTLGLSIVVFFIGIVTVGTKYGFGILPPQMMTYLWPGLVIFLLYFLYRIRNKWIVIPYLLMLLVTMGTQRTPHDAIDHAYILGNEIELIQYIEENNIRNSVILTQSTNAGIFTFDRNNNTIVTNYAEPNITLFEKIFFANSIVKASNIIDKTLRKNNIDKSKDIYIAFSTVKNLNQYLWVNEWFRKPSLDGANLALFNNGDYFTPIFDNDDIKMWKWTHKID